MCFVDKFKLCHTVQFHFMKQKNFSKINKNCLFMKICGWDFFFFLIDFSFADTGCFLFSRFFFLINLFIFMPHYKLPKYCLEW